MSVRQAQQLLARYQDSGGAALIHRSRGRTTSNRLSHGVREYVLELVRPNHRDFGPTLAAEVLREQRPSSACFHFFTAFSSPSGLPAEAARLQIAILPASRFTGN